MSINLNTLAQKKARTIGAIALGVLMIIGIGVLVMIHFHKKHQIINRPTKPNAFESAIDNVAFSGVHHQELVDEQNATSQLSRELDQLKKQQHAQQQSYEQQIKALKKAQSAKPPVAPKPKVVAHNKGPQIHLHDGLSDKLQSNLQSKPITNITDVKMWDFHYANPNKTNADQYKHYVPTGSFAQAVVLSGADGDASVNGSKRTAPILMEITSDVIEPNNHRNNLKGCFVTADTFGDISSERNMVRLVSLSCNKHNGSVLDLTNIEGFVTDGKYGIRGRVVTRNGKLLFYSGVSGLASGLGDAIKQQYTTQSISPLGSTSTVNNDKTFQYAGATGVSTALGKLADYYIKRADQYHSVVELNPGSQVTIVFQKGFSTDPKSPVNHKTPKRQVSTSVNQAELAKELKEAGLGSRINLGGLHHVN